MLNLQLPYLLAIVEETSDNTIDEEIPVSLPSPNTDIQEPQISHTAQKETEDKPMILVIDDHKDIVWLITETLSSEYQVQEAYNAGKGSGIPQTIHSVPYHHRYHDA